MSAYTSFDALFHSWESQLRHFIDIKIRGNQVIEQLYATRMPAPFLSVLTDDCIAQGLDYNAGGARYNTSYIQGVGIGTLTDSLAAIKQHVYEENSISAPDLFQTLDQNFQGNESLRQTLLNKSPKWGNDDDRADTIMQRAFEAFFSAVDGRYNARSGSYHIDMLPTTCHIYFGAKTGATPDGRLALKPLSEGISPVQGRDRKGPTAVLLSAAKMDHTKTGGTLLNMKFTPDLLKGESGIDNLAHLIRTYFALGGHHIQLNVVDARTLRDAMKRPEEHRNLIVRVAGYSDYFCDLNLALQEEIISRMEHEGW
jgi:formate C-acetyltransferase